VLSNSWTTDEDDKANILPSSTLLLLVGMELFSKLSLFELLNANSILS
jgi:hypothetical protein